MECIYGRAFPSSQVQIKVSTHPATCRPV